MGVLDALAECSVSVKFFFDDFPSFLVEFVMLHV